MEKYDKLVRDNIPNILDAKNFPYELEVLDNEKYKIELIKKLGEEVAEFLVEGDVEELADVIEVVEALKKLPEYQNVYDVRMQKLEEKGGFEKKFKMKGEK